MVGLRKAACDGAPDVTIERGSFPAKPGWRVVDGIFQLAIANVAAYEARRNGKIVVASAKGSDPEAVQRTLLGKAMAAVAYQRGELPIHAATIAVDGRLIAIAGRSQQGKSTLANALVQSGYEVVSDDLLLLRTPSDRLPEAMPGTTRLRLDPSTAGMARCEKRRVGWSETPGQKDYVATPRARAAGMRPLAAIHRLEWGVLAIDPVPASNRIMKLADIMHMWSLHEKLGDRERMRRAAFALVTQVPVYQFCRPRWKAGVGTMTAMLEKHFQKLSRDAGVDGLAHAVERNDARRYLA